MNTRLFLVGFININSKETVVDEFNKNVLTRPTYSDKLMHVYLIKTTKRNLNKLHLKIIYAIIVISNM